MAARPTEPRFFGRMAQQAGDPGKLQAKAHVQREIHPILLDLHLLRMQHILGTDFLIESLLESIERRSPILPGRLHFDWGDPWLARSVRIGLLNQEVNLHSLFTLRFPRLGIEKQIMTARNKHLGNDIFRKHPLVYPNFPAQDRSVNALLDAQVICEGEADEKPCVRHVALKRRLIHAE